MKTTFRQTSALVATLTAAAAFTTLAEQPAPVGGPEKTYTGVIVSVDGPDHMLRVKSWLLSQKEFNIGVNCSLALWGINNGNAGCLRPGQKVAVRFGNSHGVLIAYRIEQEPMQYEGMVTETELNHHTLILLHRHGMNQPIPLANDCTVALKGNKMGVLTDIQPGDYVTVTYEMPAGRPVARQIAQTSSECAGKLTAIDLEEKTVKAKGAGGILKFNLADDCAIVINGRTDGKLSQLRPDEKLQFSYETINGVNVVDRIAPLPVEPRDSLSSSAPRSLGYPAGF